MSSRDGDDPSPAGPARLQSQRRSRISEARGYHPRGRTAAEAPQPRPPLRLVGEEDIAAPVRRRSSNRSADARAMAAPTTDAQEPGSRTAGPRTAGGRSIQSRAGAVPNAASRTANSRTAGPHAANRSAAAPPTAQARTRAARAANAARGSTRPLATAPRPQLETPRLADQQRRLRAGTTVILALFLLIAGRLVQIQITDAPEWAAKGLSQRTEKIDLPAPRGSIVDRNGSILAGSAEARYVFADPGLVKDPAATAAKLVGVLGVPASQLLPRLVPHKRDDGTAVRFEYLARGVPVATGDAVSALNLPGIGVVRDETRVVPGHDLAANLIGFTGRDLTGLAGLEASYDRVLRGVKGLHTYEIGQPDGDVNLDHEIPGGYSQTTPAQPGSSLQLTIDRDLQFEIQRILGAKMRAQRADVGAAVVLDVRTGEVLAQASYPFYDAADPFAAKQSDWGDNATGYAVEPGSVHKGIVFAACLQEGVITPTSTVLVQPSITKGDVRFTDTHQHNSPTWMTLPGILAWSSNVGTIELADKLTAQKLYEYQRAFGLGEMTGEGLPGESAGLVQPPQNWSETAHGSVPIGHGVSVTPLQMAAVYAAIANGGTWVQPHLVKAIISPDGTATPTEAAPTRRVISAENAAALRTMLEAVVTADKATGRSAAVDNYRVAGKTGTGRVIENGKPVPGEVASFVGMAPADAPRYVIAVFAHVPAGSGGKIEGSAFAEMMQYTLLHYRVAPTGTKPPVFRIYP